MAQPVDWMGMAACILRDPLFAGASAKHARIITDVSALERNSRHAKSRNLNHAISALLWRQQENPRRAGVHVAIRRNFLMLAHIGVFQP